mmetsp:Transcript_25361/g.29235  ORF Transcript_25361/g.29235 Transcript_25361/m.29235 type:complete len:104 (-) Transcript_25361:74-385(-)
MSIQDIAQRCAEHNHICTSETKTRMSLSFVKRFARFIDRNLLGGFGGSCVVLTSPNSKFNDVKVNVRPPKRTNDAATVVVTVGGISVIEKKSLVIKAKLCCIR